MKWLMSFETRAVFKTDRGISANSPHVAMYLIDEHPALLVAKNRRDLRALEEAEYDPTSGLQRVDEIVHIISAIEVPPGTLTEEQETLIE